MMTREHVDLCGPWRFQPTPVGNGERAECFQPQYDATRWSEAAVPNSFDAIASILDCYEGEGWFRRTFNVPRNWEGKRVVLRFEGVNYHAKVWVNGQEAGEHQDGFLRFEFPIQDLVDFGGENVVAVRADNIRRDGEVPRWFDEGLSMSIARELGPRDALQLAIALLTDSDITLESLDGRFLGHQRQVQTAYALSFSFLR